MPPGSPRSRPSSPTRPTPLTEASLASAVDALASRDPDLGAIVARFGRPPLWDREPGFPTLVHLILEQQVSLASAQAAFDRLRLATDPLTPAAFLRLDDAELLAIGFSRQKTRYARALRTALADGALDLDALPGLDDAAVDAALTALPGIGPWTATIYRLMVLGRPDAWPIHDIALAQAIAEVRGLDRRPGADEMLALAEGWRPWRAVAARILWHHYLSVRAERARPPVAAETRAGLPSRRDLPADDAWSSGPTPPGRRAVSFAHAALPPRRSAAVPGRARRHRRPRRLGGRRVRRDERRGRACGACDPDRHLRRRRAVRLPLPPPDAGDPGRTALVAGLAGARAAPRPARGPGPPHPLGRRAGRPLACPGRRGRGADGPPRRPGAGSAWARSRPRSRTRVPSRILGTESSPGLLRGGRRRRPDRADEGAGGGPVDAGDGGRGGGDPGRRVLRADPPLRDRASTRPPPSPCCAPWSATSTWSCRAATCPTRRGRCASRLDAATAADESTHAYVGRLEAMVDESRQPEGDDLITEIERFLRDQSGGAG